MLLNFFTALRQGGLSVSLTEWLALMEAMEAGLSAGSVEDFYYLARSILVKDESRIDRFDRVFSSVFKGIVGEGPTTADVVESVDIPHEWLKKLAEKYLTEEEKREIQSLGGFDKLMETLRQRLEEQKGRHQGGSKWIGTAGTSPFGAYGYNPEGVRIGQDESRHRRAVKVWDKREFRDLDDSVEIGTRAIKIALRRLRRFARSGRPDELDLDGTIRQTARQGWLDVQMRPERRNAVRLLVLFDIGGSMDDHVRVCEELFSALRGEFHSLDYYYFHNCLYEGVWKTNRRRHAERIETDHILRSHGPETRVILVGDASMSPYEIAVPGGSVEHWNAEAGAVWMRRLTAAFPRLAWINPLEERYWAYTHSIQMICDLVEGRMFPLTLDGLDRTARLLAR